MHMNLRTAVSNIHRDPLWWRKVLIGGALCLTVFGMPWAAGLVMQSYDNVRRGYPTPLPPGGDWSTRYIIGFMALMIDFVFFLLPVMVVGFVVLCGSLALALSTTRMSLSAPGMVGLAIIALYWLFMFGISVAPVSRLIYAADGRAEETMNMQTIRDALHPEVRADYARARLRSLPAYLPALLFGLLCWLVLTGALPGALLAALVLLWLTLSALLYAHLVVAQLYATIAHEKRLYI
jgi:hypothetical protein